MLGVATDRAGRACVGPFLTVPDAPNVFVVGDTATLVQNGKPLPGVAQVAIQQGRYVGRLISRKLRGRKPPRPFRYFDKGNMAVVGKNFAIMETRHTRLAGFTAWCPSSDDLRQFGCFRKGGSGSSVVEIKRHAGDAANDDLRWSGV